MIFHTSHKTKGIHNKVFGQPVCKTRSRVMVRGRSLDFFRLPDHREYGVIASRVEVPNMRRPGRRPTTQEISDPTIIFEKRYTMALKQIFDIVWECGSTPLIDILCDVYEINTFALIANPISFYERMYRPQKTNAELQLSEGRRPTSERPHCVYMIIDTTTGLPYIGRTSDWSRRFSEHLLSPQSALHDVIQHIGADSIESFVLAHCLTLEESIQIEAERIRMHDTVVHGLNRKHGG